MFQDLNQARTNHVWRCRQCLKIYYFQPHNVFRTVLNVVVCYLSLEQFELADKYYNDQVTWVAVKAFSPRYCAIPDHDTTGALEDFRALAKAYYALICWIALRLGTMSAYKRLSNERLTSFETLRLVCLRCV